jgi:hypothetical protein
MRNALSFLGYALLIAMILHVACRHGTKWEFGRYGMPRTLVAADGVSYLDGTEIDEYSLALARSGNEEEVWLAIYAIIGTILAYGTYSILMQRRRYFAAFYRELERLHREQDARRARRGR